MAINLKKIKIPYKGVSTSWSDFYTNMALEMAENVAKQKATAVANRIGVSQTITQYVDDFTFAQSLTEEYDKVIKGGGKTIIGGVKVQLGNTVAMQALLQGILAKTRADPAGDLLRDIGPAIQAYWLGAQLEKFPPPSIPCVGAVRNVSTILGVNFSPGVWTPIVVPPMFNCSPWILNFIISAQLHLLTVGGLFTCTCTYPPPAPPAPGILPWAGYFVNPVSIPSLSALDWKDLTSLGRGLLLETIIDDNAQLAKSFEDLAVNFVTSTFGQFVKADAVVGEYRDQAITEQDIENSIRDGINARNANSNLANTQNNRTNSGG